MKREYYLLERYQNPGIVYFRSIDTLGFFNTWETIQKKGNVLPVTLSISTKRSVSAVLYGTVITADFGASTFDDRL